MAAHINHLGSLADTAESSLDHVVGVAYESNDSAVGSLAGVNVEQPDAGHALDSISDFFDFGFVASLREIGDTLDNTGFHRYREKIIGQW
mgnify:CR=1 FL=1